MPAVIGVHPARHDNLQDVDADVPLWRTVAVARKALAAGGTESGTS